MEYNDAFCSFYRISPDTMFSMQISQYHSLFNFYSPDGKRATVKDLPIARSLRGEQVKKTEYSIHRIDTDEHWVGSFSFSPIRDNEGAITGSVVVARDITDTKKAEQERERLIEQLASEKEALAESEERYRIMGEAVDYGIWAADAEGKVTYLSESFCNLVGKSFEELKEHGWHENLVIEQSQKIMELWMYSVKTGEPYEHEHQIIGKHGEKKHILARARPIRNNKGEITSWAGIHLDITDRKIANKKLEEQYKNLRRINKVMEDFVHIAGHDLRSPIGNLVSLSELISRQKNIDKKAELFQMSLPVTKRLQQTVDGLLEMVNIQMEEEVHATQIHFDKVWNTVLEVLAHEVKEFQGTLEKDFSKAPQIVYSDVHLVSILRNLVSNAIKYSDENKDSFIKILTKRENGFVLLEVHDNGIGIDLKRAKEGMFKPFKRFTKKAGGTGMGLYLVKNIIEKNGGFIKVESQP
ncbi:MAG: sensor histidine kinase, partial [Mariniphaga sp.]